MLKQASTTLAKIAFFRFSQIQSGTGSSRQLADEVQQQAGSQAPARC